METREHPTLETRSRTRVDFIAAAGALVTFALCLRGAGRSYSYDESVTVAFFVDRPLGTPFLEQRVANNHPFFSFLEQLVWQVGGTSEAAMRLLPALFAALTVGVLMWWTRRRWTTTASLAAGAVLLANPFFVEFGQSVRGYSLFVLAAVVSTIAAIDLLDREEHEEADRLALVYVVAAAIGLTTHLYMAIVLAGHGSLVLARGRLSLTWVRRWLLVGGAAALVFANAMPERRTGVFDASFPLDTAWGLFANDVVAAIALGAACVACLSANRRDLALVTGPLLVAGVIWAVLHPLDLYPRFFVFVVPAIAAATAWCVARRPRFLAPVAVAAALMLPTGAPVDHGLDEVAATLLAIEADGHLACAVGAEALSAYTFEVQPFHEDAECDVVALVGSWSPRGLDEATQMLTDEAVVGTVTLHARPGLLG